MGVSPAWIDALLWKGAQLAERGNKGGWAFLVAPISPGLSSP